MKKLTAFISVGIVMLLLSACSSNTVDADVTDVNKSVNTSFESNIISILKTNPDLENFIDNDASLNIINVSYDFFMNERLPNYYKDLFVNKTFSQGLCVAELHGTDSSFISLVDITTQEILETFYLAKIKM